MKTNENFAMNMQYSFEFHVKRTATTQNLEKLANDVLSDANIERIISNSTKCKETKKLCKQNLSWKDDQFWNNLPEPNLQIKQKTINNDNFKLVSPDIQPIFKSNKDQQQQQESKQLENTTVALTRKFFNKWKISIKNKIEHRNDLHQQIEQKEKLNDFLKRLRKFQNNTNKPNQCKSVSKLECNSNGAQESSPISPNIKTSEGTCYRYRFEAQQTIIQMQKQKLLQQEKEIQELRWGKASKEINESLAETEKEIREALSKCSVKVKSKMGAAFKIDSIEDETILKFQINSTKAPRIVQQMEQRALEREKKRQMILEKKLLIDKLKKEAIQMEIEKKKALDEEERKNRIREIKERRRREMEIQQLKQIRKRKYLEDCEKADCFYKKKLICLAYGGFQKLIFIKENNEIKSEIFHETCLKKMYWFSWKKYIDKIKNLKIAKAEECFSSNLKRKILKRWYNAYTVSIQHLQVSEDLHDFKLQSRLFIKWKAFVYMEHVVETNNLQKAQKHHNHQIILHYFYQWKLLPAVIKLEKAKEEKKRKWREKVWEILPDYTPTVED